MPHRIDSCLHLAQKPSEQDDAADDNAAAALAEIYEKHFVLLGHRQRILEQYCIVVDKYAGAAG